MRVRMIVGVPGGRPTARPGCCRATDGMQRNSCLGGVLDNGADPRRRVNVELSAAGNSGGCQNRIEFGFPGRARNTAAPAPAARSAGSRRGSCGTGCGTSSGTDGVSGGIRGDRTGVRRDAAVNPNRVNIICFLPLTS